MSNTTESISDHHHEVVRTWQILSVLSEMGFAPATSIRRPQPLSTADEQLAMVHDVLAITGKVHARLRLNASERVLCHRLIEVALAKAWR